MIRLIYPFSQPKIEQIKNKCILNYINIIVSIHDLKETSTTTTSKPSIISSKIFPLKMSNVHSKSPSYENKGFYLPSYCRQTCYNTILYRPPSSSRRALSTSQGSWGTTTLTLQRLHSIHTNTSTLAFSGPSQALPHSQSQQC